MNSTLFQNELDVTEWAEKTLADDSYKDDPMRRDFEELLRVYRKLHGQPEHLGKIGDRWRKELKEG